MLQSKRSGKFVSISAQGKAVVPGPVTPSVMIIGTLLLILLSPLLVLLPFYMWLSPRVGSNPAGERSKRIQGLPNYGDGKLHNLAPVDMRMPPRTMAKVMWWMLRGGEGREPTGPLPVVALDKEAWERIPANEVAVAWLGHSSVLIKLDGITFLTDPVFCGRASMFTFIGPEHFLYSSRIDVAALPKVDVVLLSHDHYDHLCYDTIKDLVRLRSSDGIRFIAALGVGAHLEKWGVASSAITELEWWQEVQVGQTTLTFAPARHFTGRTMSDRFSTLWGSFVMRGASKRIYFGADSGYSPTFKEIGERFGPFDLAMLECGAYSEFWPDIHMFPEETAQAAMDVKANVLMPIHWAKFALGLHPWKESIERVTKRADELGLRLLTPRIGRIITTFDTSVSEAWWKEVG